MDQNARHLSNLGTENFCFAPYPGFRRGSALLPSSSGREFMPDDTFVSGSLLPCTFSTMSFASHSHRSTQVSPASPLVRKTANGPSLFPMVGNTRIATADPKYMPEVASETALALSTGGTCCESTECTAGINTP
eukprot:scaffold1758_cov333-Pavlova_lutheri.AAC.20